MRAANASNTQLASAHGLAENEYLNTNPQLTIKPGLLRPLRPREALDSAFISIRNPLSAIDFLLPPFVAPLDAMPRPARCRATFDSFSFTNLPICPIVLRQFWHIRESVSQKPVRFFTVLLKNTFATHAGRRLSALLFANLPIRAQRSAGILAPRGLFGKSVGAEFSTLLHRAARLRFSAVLKSRLAPAIPL